MTLLTQARPEFVANNNAQITNKQIKIANEYSKILTGMEVLDPQGADLKPAILKIESNPNLFINKMFSQPGFFDIRIANFVSRIGNEQEEPYEQIDDYQLALGLAIRDNLDFRSIFTKPFVISSGFNGVIPNRSVVDIFSNKEFSEPLNDLSLDFDQTKMKNRTVGDGFLHDGLMSSQGFGQRFIRNGTNRRPIRAVYDMYLCSKIESYMDASLSDMFVGPDISRNPGGNPHEYQQKCSGCHAVLDGQRGAFANYDEDTSGNIQRYAEVITDKYNRNQQNNPEGEGYQTTDTYWVNPLSSSQNMEKFGWRTPMAGFGVLTFANMVVQSEQFQRCMTKKLIAEFCDRSPTFIRSGNKEFISLYQSMRTDGYKMKTLITKIAKSSYCR